MPAEENKAATRRAIEEVWNQGKLATFDELISPSLVYHDPGAPYVRTYDDYKQHVIDTRNAFPDIRFTIDDMIGEGDLVMVRYTFRGTHTGDFVKPARVPATGKPVTVTGVAVVHSVGGKADEVWLEMDYLGMYRQLGLIPELQSVG